MTEVLSLAIPAIFPVVEDEVPTLVSKANNIKNRLLYNLLVFEIELI